MGRLLRATTVVSSLCSSSSLCRSPGEKSPCAVVDVLLLGNQRIYFVLHGEVDAPVKGTSEQLCCISFPELQSCSNNNTNDDDDDDDDRSKEEARDFPLVAEFQRAAEESMKHDDADLLQDRCPSCREMRGGISAVATLVTQGTHVVLFFVLQCDCVVFASFLLDVFGTQVNNNSHNGSSSNNTKYRNVGEARLLAVRWCSIGKRGVSVYRTSLQQLTVPLSVILERSNINTTPVPPLSSSQHPSPPSRRLNKNASPRLFQSTSQMLVLRIAFVRVVGCVEYVDVTWQAIEGDAPSPWRTLRGFRQMTLGALQLDTYGGGSAVQGEVRALHWMPFSRDYQQQYPLLAVLHQHTLAAGDPFMDRLSVCMLSTRRQRRKPSDDTSKDNVWAGVQETLCGSCTDGPWCLEALTLAHPSFLLHVTLQGGGLGGDGADVLGVFLRPAHVAYPMSALLRERGVYDTWAASAATPLAHQDKAQDFCFALYTESCEVTRCHIGSFVESATSCVVWPEETRRLSSSARGRDRVVAVIMTMQSGGNVLLMEVHAAAAAAATSAIRGFEENLNGAAPLLGLVVVKVRDVSLLGPAVPRPLPHLRRFVSLQWDGSRGVALFLAAQEEEETRRLQCSLLAAELRLQGGGALQLVWGCSSKGSTVESQRGGMMGTFPPRIGLSALTHPASMLDVEYNVGSVQHAQLQVLCRCTAPRDGADDSAPQQQQEEEIVLFRSGDICRIHQKSPSTMHGKCVSSCSHISRVQWPSAKDTETVAALTLLFSSGSANICMAAFYTNKGGCVAAGTQSLGGTTDAHEPHLLLVCRTTAVVMTAAGRVICVSDLQPPRGAAADDALGRSATDGTRRSASDVCSLLVCTLRPFATYGRNCWFVLSGTALSLSLSPTTGDFRESLFLLLRVSWAAGEKGGTAPLASVCVTDILSANTTVHPLFDFLSEMCLNSCTTAAADGTVLCSREMLYCADTVLRSVPCALVVRLAAGNRTVEGRFGEVPCSSGSGRKINDRTVLDLRNIAVGNAQSAKRLPAEPTLLRCVCDSNGPHATPSEVVVLSFIGGATLAAVVDSGAATCQLWEPRTSRTVRGLAGDTAVPFVHLVTPPGAINSSSSSGGGHPLCWLQGADGQWWSLAYRNAGDARSLPCDAKPSAVQCTGNPQTTTGRSLATPPVGERGAGGDDVATVRVTNDLFTLEPCK
ncbi:hypothetical protein DQ04_04871020 [Trypanosoma grayi]|uniref:hypothetical protein n=1 Tax=Trypanosoma grayi TaxID=71804 RepID=UPI0004F42E30|nr:hypothetical protein DQ04_04871020 [Trypanosoma grayi]KEG09649.1 hypothetical protein DQ04_04871020 [Trypanosoma grayi]